MAMIVPVNLKTEDKFHLTIEEYLHAVISLVEELVDPPSSMEVSTLQFILSDTAKNRPASRPMPSLSVTSSVRK